LWQFDLPERWSRSVFSRGSLDDIPAVPLLNNPVTFALLVVAGVVVLIFLLRLLSVAWAFLKLHGFNLTRRGDDLRAEYGLLTRVSKTIPRHRIQLISSRETLLHRWFDRVAVQVETAGGSGEEPGTTSDRLWLAPLIRKDELARLFREAVGEIDLDRVQWQPLAPRASRRIFRRTLVLLALLTAVGVVPLGPWGLLLPVPLLPWAYAYARLYVRCTGYALVPGAVLYRSGWWVRRLSAARFGKIQALELFESPFDRRNGMAGLRVDTAGAGPVGHRVAIAYLEATVALRLRNQLSLEAGRTAFHW
jgi:putative membrane protein